MEFMSLRETRFKPSCRAYPEHVRSRQQIEQSGDLDCRSIVYRDPSQRTNVFTPLTTLQVVPRAFRLHSGRSARTAVRAGVGRGQEAVDIHEQRDSVCSGGLSGSKPFSSLCFEFGISAARNWILVVESLPGVRPFGLPNESRSASSPRRTNAR